MKLLACIYTEHANVPTFIKEAQSDERDITIMCVEQQQSYRSAFDDHFVRANLLWAYRKTSGVCVQSHY